MRGEASAEAGTGAGAEGPPGASRAWAAGRAVAASALALALWAAAPDPSLVDLRSVRLGTLARRSPQEVGGKVGGKVGGGGRLPAAAASDGATLADTTAGALDGIPYARLDCRPCPAGSGPGADPAAPLAIIAGAMKGGTRALLTYLSRHPRVHGLQGEEVHLLDNRKTKIFRSKLDPVCDACAVHRAYRDIFAGRRAEECRASLGANTNATLAAISADGCANATDGLAFFDKSPSYMAYSPIVPQRIVCAYPATARVVFVLRDPVDRAYSHYWHCVGRDHGRTEGCNGQTFAEYVAKDRAGLERAGVPNATARYLGGGGGGDGGDDGDDDGGDGLAEEHRAYVRYLGLGGDRKDFVLAKGLYALHLRSFLAVFRDHFGEERWRDHVLILESERMRTHRQETYDEALAFLGLEPHVLPPDEEDHHVGRYDPMDQEIREELEEFYRPHNAMLHELLAPLGIDVSWAREDYVRLRGGGGQGRVRE